MKPLTLLFLSALALPAMAKDQTVFVDVTNPDDRAPRYAVPVAIDVDDDTRSALVTLNGTEVPCQLDDIDDDGEADELAFLADLGAGETLTFRVTLSDRGKPRQYPATTYAALAIRDRDKSAKTPKHMPITAVTFPAGSNPYQHIFPHGIVMENDMVGFRAYCDQRQTIDYYGHRNRKADIAVTGFYPTKAQVAEGSGDDVLYTGTTYGCGTLHGWDGTKSVMFQRVRNTTQRVVACGPVRAIIEVVNRAWQPDTTRCPVDIRTRYYLYAGHRDVQVRVKFDGNVRGLPLSTGVVDIVGSKTFTDHEGLRAVWGTACAGNNPKVYDTHTVGLAVCVPKANYTGDAYFTDGKEQLPNQAHAVLCRARDEHINYSFIATCDMETFGYPDAKAWFNYVKQWKHELGKPCAISVSN